MSKQNDTKLDPLLSFPVGAFLMVRLEYVQIFQDELQAKLLRVIESHIETQRMVLYRDAVNKGKATTIPKDIFVPISYKLFMNDLFGTVASETTVKKGLNELIERRVIFRKEPSKKRYAAPEYSINTEGLQMLLDALKDPGYQFLIPSIFDTLKKRYPQTLVPSGYQKLIPSNSQSSSEKKSRVSEIDTNIRKKNITDKNEREQSVPQTDSPSHSSTHSSSLIANPTTENVESKATRNTSSTPNVRRNTEPLTPPSLSPDGQRIDGYLKTLRFPFPRIQENFDYLAVVAEYIQSFEQMDSYLEFTRDRFNGGIFLGNLANLNNMNMWLQTQKPQRDKPKKRKLSDAERNALPL